MLRSIFNRLGFHFHTTNDNERPGGRRGHIFWHGRATLGLGPRRPTLQASWHHGEVHADAVIYLNRDDGEVTLHFGVPGGQYWFRIADLPSRWLAWLPFKSHRTEYNYMGGHRSIGIRTFGGAIRLSLWNDDYEWRSGDPKWWDIRVGLDDVANLLFGRDRYSTETLEEREVDIPTLEGPVPAKAKRTLSRWTRPRWPWAPFSKERLGVTIDIPGGVETDHKGPMFAMSTSATSIAEGIGQVAGEVVYRRGQYTAPVRAEHPRAHEGGL